jgi:hypothetical protein
VVIDASAIFTLILLNRVEMLAKWPVCPIISTSTHHFLVEYIEDRLDHPSDKTLGLDSQGRLVIINNDGNRSPDCRKTGAAARPGSL